MDLILCDKPLPRAEAACRERGIRWVDLSKLRIANCVGCFGCWTKTPGRCVIRDDAVRVYPLIAASRRLMYVSRVRYGGYDTPMKTMLERAIPVQQAFIRLHNGETHHVQRSVVPKQALILGYGEIPEEEQTLFRQLARRNANNMSFQDYRVVFAAEQELERVVREEVESWERS